MNAAVKDHTYKFLLALFVILLSDMEKISDEQGNMARAIRAQDVLRVLRREKMVNFVHDDVIKLKHFPRYWPFVWGIHRSPVNFPHKGQWRGALMFSLICVWINGWVNNGEAGDLRRNRAHYNVTVMTDGICKCNRFSENFRISINVLSRLKFVIDSMNDIFKYWLLVKLGTNNVMKYCICITETKTWFFLSLSRQFWWTPHENRRSSQLDDTLRYPRPLFTFLGLLVTFKTSYCVYTCHVLHVMCNLTRNLNIAV